MTSLWLALGFLTTLPTPETPFAPDGLGRAAHWFPPVGLLLGGLLAGAAWLAGIVWSAGITAVFVLLLWAVLTGGLHWDGLADCCDALLVPASAEKRLAILRDPQVGSFAVVGLVLALGFKGAALTAILAGGRRWALGPLLLAPVVGRWLILLAARQPQARKNGMGADFARHLSLTAVGIAALLPLALAGWLGWRGLVALAAACSAGLAWVWLARRRIGGVTGDVYGAVVETAEIVVLLVYAAGT